MTPEDMRLVRGNASARFDEIVGVAGSNSRPTLPLMQASDCMSFSSKALEHERLVFPINVSSLFRTCELIERQSIGIGVLPPSPHGRAARGLVQD